MRDKFPDFVWYPQEKSRLELEPEIENFVVEPQAERGIRIIGSNTVC